MQQFLSALGIATVASLPAASSAPNSFLAVGGVPYWSNGTAWQAVSFTAGTPVVTETNPEFTYTSGVLTRIDYASGNYKVFNYDGGGVLQSIAYHVGAATITKTFHYNPDGSLDSITQTES